MYLLRLQPKCRNEIERLLIYPQSKERYSKPTSNKIKRNLKSKVNTWRQSWKKV